MAGYSADATPWLLMIMTPPGRADIMVNGTGLPSGLKNKAYPHLILYPSIPYLGMATRGREQENATGRDPHGPAAGGTGKASTGPRTSHRYGEATINVAQGAKGT